MSRLHVTDSVLSALCRGVTVPWNGAPPLMLLPSVHVKVHPTSPGAAPAVTVIVITGAGSGDASGIGDHVGVDGAGDASGVGVGDDSGPDADCGVGIGDHSA